MNKLLITITLYLSALQLNANENYSHLIISSSEFKNDTDAYSLTTFSEFRTKNGIKSKIVTVDSIYANFTGRDSCEQIKNFIKQAVQINEVEYILLAGDVNIIPARMLNARNRNVAADMYYACLDGDFKANNNDIWGEADDSLDFEFDVYLGRASAENLEEIRNFVYKTITYEESPINASYHSKMVQYNANNKGIGNTKAWNRKYTSHNEEITAEYYFLKPEESDSVINTRLNSGNVGFYLGASHGLKRSIGNINADDADAFTNGDQFFLINSIACLTGKFDTNCVAEHLTTSTRTGGAFAGFFNSHDAVPPYIVQYIYTIRDSLLLGNVNELGKLRAYAANRYSHDEYVNGMPERYQAYIYNLFGDPATKWKINISEAIDLKLVCNDNKSLQDISGNKNNVEIKGKYKFNKKNKSVSLTDKDSYIVVKHNQWNPVGAQKELSVNLNFYLHSLQNDFALLHKGNDSLYTELNVDKQGYVTFKSVSRNFSEKADSILIKSNNPLTLQEFNSLTLIINAGDNVGTIMVNNEELGNNSIPENFILPFTSSDIFIGKQNGLTSSASNKIEFKEISVYSRALDSK